MRIQVAGLVTDAVDIKLIAAHCNIDLRDDSYDDELLELYWRSAILWAEGQMKRTILARSHRWVLREFPYDCFSEIRLPRGKTQSVDSIVYKVSSSPITLTGPDASPPGSAWQQDLTGDDGGVLMPPLGGSWPSADLNVPDPVVVNFTAGWELESIPDDILVALLFYVSDAFEIRGTDDIEKGRHHDIRLGKLSPYSLEKW